jgi:phosphonopyruvate decarboxylase
MLYSIVTMYRRSREVFELREQRGEGHGHDFLTVGSMGHCSSIAMVIFKPRCCYRYIFELL